MIHNELSLPISQEHLKKIYLFTHLTDEQLYDILKTSRCLSLSAHETLFEHGQTAHHFYLTYTGQIKLFRLSPEGQEKVIEVIQPGQLFAEAVMFMQGQHYPVTAEALTATKVISFYNLTFLEVLKDSMDTCFKLMASMSMRLHHWLNEIDRLTLQNATCRLMAFLYQQIPPNTHSPITLQLDTPKHILASLLSIQPETLSRILKNLIEQGVISVEGKSLTIHHLEKLRSLTNSSS